MESKQVIFEKMSELAQILAITGALTEDGQSMFISHCVMTTLTASQKENHALLLFKHLHAFLEEVQVMEGEKGVNEHLIEIDRYEN